MRAGGDRLGGLNYDRQRDISQRMNKRTNA
jgi:hypothetical protein